MKVYIITSWARGVEGVYKNLPTKETIDKIERDLGFCGYTNTMTSLNEFEVQ